MSIFDLPKEKVEGVMTAEAVEAARLHLLASATAYRALRDACMLVSQDALELAKKARVSDSSDVAYMDAYAKASSAGADFNDGWESLRKAYALLGVRAA